MWSKEFTKEAYVAKSESEDNQSLKTIRSWLLESEVSQSLKFIRVWSQEPGVSYIYWRHKIAEGIEAWSNDYFGGIKRHWLFITERAQRKGNSIIVQPLLHYSTHVYT